MPVLAFHGRVCYNYITNKTDNILKIKNLIGGCFMHEVGESLAKKSTLKMEALNCIENMLIREEISVGKYEFLHRVIELLGCENSYNLGEGIIIKIVDCKTP